MTRTADVVVVGAGIIGSSIAYQLARHEAGSVVVLDKGAGPAEGSPPVMAGASRGAAHWQAMTPSAMAGAGLAAGSP